MAKFLRTKIYNNYYLSIKEMNQFYLYYDLIKNNHESLVGKIANIKNLDLSSFKETNQYFNPVVERTKHYDNAMLVIEQVTSSYDLAQINALLTNFQKLNHIPDLLVDQSDQDLVDYLNKMELVTKNKLEQSKLNNKQTLETKEELVPIQLNQFHQLTFKTTTNKKRFNFNVWFFIVAISTITLLLLIFIILIASGVL
ncbi:hypothetical protein JM47_00140 [Ureaplasma diversum]|uniref:Uncharacterized protein n=1 Tax=Ureaplasma diversum TaxID=42094 RepID=A0A0C5RKZ6_9BACT|nr:hypothetical protein [Ureaplasma diversum]AJQ45087.1 hypothetical protein JM47_00140 [Ureaplasma diversum]